MGTPGAVGFRANKQDKVTYNHFDSYPSGLGSDVISFIRSHSFEDIKIAVAGTGYVGLSIATLLSQHHEVTAVDVIPEKVEKINNKISPIQDDYIEKYCYIAAA